MTYQMRDLCTKKFRPSGMRLFAGRMRPADMRFVTSCIKDVLTEIGVALPVTQVAAGEPSPMTEVAFSSPSLFAFIQLHV